jgi:hypothetical protein
MSEPKLLSVGWARVKEYAPAVMAAAVMFGGLKEMISMVKYPVSGLVLGLINAIIRKAFRNQLPLSGDTFFYLPWQFEARRFAMGVIVLVVGMFLGLLANARSRRQFTP